MDRENTCDKQAVTHQLSPIDTKVLGLCLNFVQTPQPSHTTTYENRHPPHPNHEKQFHFRNQSLQLNTPNIASPPLGSILNQTPPTLHCSRNSPQTISLTFPNISQKQISPQNKDPSSKIWASILIYSSSHLTNVVEHASWTTPFI